MAQFSSCCISGHIHDGTPEGTETVIDRRKTYIKSPSDETGKAILLIHDIFGYESINSRLLADEYSKAGYTVYLPDFIDGDVLPMSLLKMMVPTTAQQETMTPEEIGANKGQAYAMFGAWISKHHPSTAYPLIKSFITSLHEEKHHPSVGVVGLCWGGWAAVFLTHEGEETVVDAAVSIHPGGLTVPDDFVQVAKPLLFQVGDLDDLIPMTEVPKVEEVLKGKEGCQVKVYEGQVHGFAARGDYSVEKERKAKELCAQNTLEFLGKYMK